jgi:hypothetical protein
MVVLKVNFGRLSHFGAVGLVVVAGEVEGRAAVPVVRRVDGRAPPRGPAASSL